MDTGLREEGASKQKARECFQAKWTPVRVKKTRQNEGLESLNDRAGSFNDSRENVL
jgi:hypothetical protein